MTVYHRHVFSKARASNTQKASRGMTLFNSDNMYLSHVFAAHLADAAVDDDFVDCRHSNQDVDDLGNEHCLSTKQHANFPTKESQQQPVETTYDK